MVDLLDQIAENLQAGDDEQVGGLTRQAVEEGIPPKAILDRALIGGMNVVGEKFRVHEIFLPEVLMAARAMYAGMDVLKPLLIRDGIPLLGKVVLGTVQGDLHDIGKNLVGIMLRGAGFEVIDLGHDVTPAAFVETALREKAGVVGMSALLTTTMPMMREVVKHLRSADPAGGIKTIVGGAPVTAEFARSIGADAYGFDGTNAVDRVKALVQFEK